MAKDFIEKALTADNLSIFQEFKAARCPEGVGDLDAINDLLTVFGAIEGVKQAAGVDSVLDLLQQRNQLLAVLELYQQEGASLIFEEHLQRELLKY